MTLFIYAACGSATLFTTQTGQGNYIVEGSTSIEGAATAVPQTRSQADLNASILTNGGFRSVSECTLGGALGGTELERRRAARARPPKPDLRWHTCITCTHGLPPQGPSRAGLWFDDHGSGVLAGAHLGRPL